MFTKTIIKKNRKFKFGIKIERISENKFRIIELFSSRNGKDWFSHGDNLKNNHCIYIISKTFGVDNKLLFNNKPVESYEIGTFTCFHIDDSNIIPCILIDEAIEKIRD